MFAQQSTWRKPSIECIDTKTRIPTKANDKSPLIAYVMYSRIADNADFLNILEILNEKRVFGSLSVRFASSSEKKPIDPQSYTHIK
jgi:hypothetical protein